MINLIAAVGLNGELGYKGKIPWLDDPNIVNVVKADLGWFARQTEGGILVVGAATYREMLTMGFQPGTRDVWAWNGSEPARFFLEQIEAQFPDRDVWICGGARTYRAFMPFVQRYYISRIPWTGPADRFMPPIQGNWGYIGGPIQETQAAIRERRRHRVRAYAGEPENPWQDGPAPENDDEPR